MEKEAFEWKKFKKMFWLHNVAEWIKSVKEIVDLRKLIIYSLVVGIIFAYGWHKGKRDVPVKIDLGYGKAYTLKLDGTFLHIAKTGDVYVQDKEGNRLKQLSLEDIPELRRRLLPFGFQLKPIAIAGAGYGEEGIVGEGGVGLSWFRYFRFRAESFLTNKGAYPVAVAYKLTDCSGFGVGAGKGYKGDTRGILYYRWNF